MLFLLASTCRRSNTSPHQRKAWRRHCRIRYSSLVRWKLLQASCLQRIQSRLPWLSGHGLSNQDRVFLRIHLLLYHWTRRRLHDHYHPIFWGRYSTRMENCQMQDQPTTNRIECRSQVFLLVSITLKSIANSLVPDSIHRAYREFYYWL